ncbi:tRNA preQ1(34) S-adenosylmethionine ribosyltransferase-isomerase QueA [Candidatus Puniceispirillum sp.]|uniref:tRNA preQ1(34) S-adenosylmethionine ribosyltransferase-isomerase QueA n=1 Tax=Candidatus Puniceispirillum sp. TaxID=2026719 RepID=UPI003F6A08E2
MKLSDFDFDLPPDRIATAPAQPRDSARLLDLSGAAIADRHVGDLPDLLRAGDLLIVNDTSVIPARLIGKRGEAKISVTLHKYEGHKNGGDAIWRVFAKPAKKCRPDDIIMFAPDFGARVLGRGASGDVELAFIDPRSGAALDTTALHAGLDKYGTMPLPPYIARPDGVLDADLEDYQTMFASQRGAVAAPTAGLHFTDGLTSALQAKGVAIAAVTLHVGAGTFLPVTVETIAEHKMHSEWGAVPADVAAKIIATKQAGGRVVAVGTTSLRILEASFAALGHIGSFAGETDIFITPGFQFNVVDMLMTNFHLPKSTLLMLVSAFAGHAPIMAAYEHAIASGYRFFSYGDACLLSHNLLAHDLLSHDLSANDRPAQSETDTK